MTLDQVREHLVKMQTARTWSSGRVTELEDAIRLIEKVLQVDASARIKVAATGKNRKV